MDNKPEFMNKEEFDTEVEQWLLKQLPSMGFTNVEEIIVKLKKCEPIHFGLFQYIAYGGEPSIQYKDINIFGIMDKYNVPYIQALVRLSLIIEFDIATEEEKNEMRNWGN